MKAKLIFPLALFFALCLPAGAQNKAYTIEDIPNVQLTDQRRFVSNPDGILSPAAVYRIDTMLWSLRSSGRAQVAVVAVNSIGDADPFDFLLRLMSKKEGGWGVGGPKDNGLGILLVIDQGAIEIQTGYGLEGDLTDAYVTRVINNYMLPAFRQRDWDGGMIAGVEAIKGILDGAVPEDISGGTYEQGWMPLIMGSLCLLLPFALIFVMIWRSNRCPRCKKRKLKRVNSRTYLKGGRRVTENTYVCQNCGYTVRKDHIDSGGSGLGPIIGGGMIGGMGRGFGGFGGGSSGGSWGGGSFGGGGGRGRF